MAFYYLNNDGTVTKKRKEEQKTTSNSKGGFGSNLPAPTQETPKKKTIVDDAVSLGKTIMNLPTTRMLYDTPINKVKEIKKIYDYGKNAVENTPKIVNQIDMFRRQTPTQKLQTAGMTGLNVMRNIGEGALKTVESGIDAGADIFGGASDIINTKLEKATGLHKGQTESEVNKKKAETRKQMIAQDTTSALLGLAGDNPETQALYEKGSLVKKSNFGGQLSQNIGQQAARLLIGEAAGLNNPKSLTQYIPIGATSYGSGLEEAYNEGATTSEARRYAIGSAATEIITEWATGGIPGVEGSKGGLDKLVEKLMGESLDTTSSSIAKYLLKKGYKLAGEGGEEVLSNAINPFLKQFTYAYNNQKDLFGNISEAWANENLESMINDFIMGAVSAGILEAPSSINEYNNIINNNRIKEQQKKLIENQVIENTIESNNLIKNQNNIPILNKNTIDSINIPSTENTSQNSIKLPTNVSQNTQVNINENTNTVENTNPLQNLQEYNQKQQEIKEQRQVEETNKRLDTLEKQLETQEKQNNLTLEEIEELKLLQEMDEAFGLEPSESKRMNFLQMKQEGYTERYPGLKKVQEFKDIAKVYGKYKNTYDFDNKLLKQAEDVVPGYRNTNRRTKQEWLDVAKYIGTNFKENSSEALTKYALQSWINAQPNQKNNLNRQGSKYVRFGVEEWINAVYEGARVGELEKPTISSINYNQPIIPTARDFNQVKLPTVEKNNNMVYNDASNLRQRNNFDFDVQEGDLVNEFHDELSPREWVEYHSKMNKVLNSTYGDFTRLDLINGKLVETVFENGKEQVVDIIHPNGDVAYLTNYVMDEVNNGKYSHEQIQRFVEEMFGEGNFTRNNPTNNINKSNEEQRNDSRQVNEDSRYSNRITDETNNSKTNRRELENSSFSLPTKENNKTSMPMVMNNDVLKVESKRIANQINKTGGFDLKQRSWIETSTESDVLKDKIFIEDLDKGMINYVVQSNKKSLDSANKHLDTYGYEKSLDYVNNLLQSDGLPKASDVALMQRMIQEAAKRGDTETVQNLVMDTAILGTDLGQATQALSMIKRLTPEGQLTMYTKLVQRAKARGEKSFQNVEITPEMVENILEAYNKDGTYDQDDLNARVEQFKQDIADQMKTTVGEKVDAWRYLAMLGNPKTHIRNSISNLANMGAIQYKNAIARTLETILPVKERTKTWKQASNEIKEFSKKTAEDMKGIITGEAKYNEKSAIESKKKIFKNKTLEKISNFNSEALEAEDWFFSKRAFQSTLQEYLTANGIRTEEDIRNNPEIVEKAKTYAVEQAEIATFRQYSKLASMINQFERKGKVGKVAVEALMPFKKTPINVAKAGVNYSPLGLIKTISYDAYQLKQGNINASQFIDNLSQGLTGTSLTLLGYALAKAGILTGSGGDDKDDKYDKQLGNTGYSLNIGGNSYSISWLSPVAMPLLVGSNAYEQLEEGKEWDMNVVSDSLAKTLDPLNEMSFMQGVTNALNSYSSGVDKWKGIGESTAQNYVGQFFPTLFSQLASTTDDTKRSTKASANSKYKFGEQTIRSIMYKVPGLRQQLEPATDIWGNAKEQSSNIIERAFESFIAPYSKTKDISTNLDKEIKRVYNETGENKVIPSVPYAYTKYKDETYRMSAKEYTQYKKTYGNTASSTLNSLINSNPYKNASNEDKAKMIDNVYDYARAKANEEYFKNVDGVEYESKILDKINTLNQNYGINASTYFGNKNEYDYAYQNPNKYSVIRQITSYDKYTTYKDKLTEIRNSTTNDKQETIKYINSLPMNVAQKAMFIKQYYKTYKNYDKEIVKYINNQKLTQKEKEQVLTQLGFTVKDGRVYY